MKLQREVGGKGMPTSGARERSISTKPIPARKGTLLVVLSWGSVAWYLSVRPAMTVAELREHLAGKIGRLFDRVVVGLELLITGTVIAPDLHIPLDMLTHAGCRNVCLDVTAGSPAPAALSVASIGEHLLRKHMNNEPFQVGVDQRIWRLIELRWPHAVFGISSLVENKRCELGLRLNFEKYPLAPPVLELWDVAGRTSIGAEHWPQAFVRFAIENYPQFVDLAHQSYCHTVLCISTEVAGRRKERAAERWDPNGDLTQVLARASCCFRISQTLLPAVPPRQTSLQSNQRIRSTARAPAQQLP
jgi:hypothetical protein